MINSSSPLPISIDFDDESGLAIIFVDIDETDGSETANSVQVELAYDQLRQFLAQSYLVRQKMEWHQATWLYISEGLSSSTLHLMRKEEAHKKGEALCGRTSTSSRKEWDLSPVIGEPDRSLRSMYRGGICQRCLANYNRWLLKQGKEEANGVY